jgi:hypothetical protein
VKTMGHFHWGVVGLIVATWLTLASADVRAATPEFRLVPDRGRCEIFAPAGEVAVQSANFTPGMDIVIIERIPPTQINIAGDGFIRLNGTLPTDRLAVAYCGPDTPDGTVFTFEVYERLQPPIGPGSPRTGQKLAVATFTATRAAPALPGLPNTGAGGAHAPMLLPFLAVPLPLMLILSLLALGLGWRRQRFWRG